jgi:hypothetical protein
MYKKAKKYGLAVRAVSHAIQIEEYMFRNETRGEKYEIIQTYLNKAAILSEMAKHGKAVEEICKARKIVEAVEKELKVGWGAELENEMGEELQRRAEEKRHYVMYMKMVINYNMGVEKEHMKLIESAIEYYRSGRKLAQSLNNDFMIKKFDSIIRKLIPTK